ncbi:MAG: hypothetical protein A2161_06855 [Candidatus Schekmanbacteria bacterium RBG_13_48_7]|uniref:Exosortase H n=1 Tax=Candidatus Schekmanbacteria bacterium RBG_13_48_7 TaxID=1817878 RepID=A0A1F7S2A2_9BACT|nr:MAG: hypothetical protein A2161_06855 [Candidatus Schekmanbacteria bacterium RBG_13_48_7]
MKNSSDLNYSNNQSQSDEKLGSIKKKHMDKATKRKFTIQSASILLKFYGLSTIFIVTGYLLSRWDHTFQVFNYSLNFKTFILKTFPGFVAQSVGFVANLLGINVSIHGEKVQFLTFNGFEYPIIPDEAVYFVLLIFSAAVIAFPSKTTDKIYGLFLGIPGLYFINITRLVFIGLVSSKHHACFDYLHEYVWQAIFIVLVIGLWIVWLHYIVRHFKGVIP